MSPGAIMSPGAVVLPGSIMSPGAVVLPGSIELQQVDLLWSALMIPESLFAIGLPYPLSLRKNRPQKIARSLKLHKY